MLKFLKKTLKNLRFKNTYISCRKEIASALSKVKTLVKSSMNKRDLKRVPFIKEENWHSSRCHGSSNIEYKFFVLTLMYKKTKRNTNNNKYNNGLKCTHNYKQSPYHSQSYWLCLLTHYDKHQISSVETQDCRNLIPFPKRFDLLRTQMFLWLTQYLSVADNARDAVLLHVYASSDRQEWRNETSAMKKTT